MQRIKDALHGTTGLLGFRISRTGYGAIGWATAQSKFIGRVFGHPHVFVPDESHRFTWLKKLNIKTVIDIGAHQGEFAKRIHELLPDASIISFEPLPSCFRELEQYGKTLPRHRAFNYALGASRGRATMHQSEFTQTSSLLPPSEGMERQMPFAARAHPIEVDVETLDGVCSGLSLEDDLFVKIDVQGFECQVIAGARSTLARARLVLVETSFQPIYEDQPLFGAVYRELVEGLGFRYLGSWDRQQSPVDGFPLQEDSIFIRDPR